MLNKFKLPQNLKELSNITDKNYPVEKWSGAVIMLIIEDYLVFIKRADTMPSHKGQIGFMGGHKQASEMEPWQTTCREFEEESNLNSGDLKFQGLVHPVWTSKRKVIIPVLAEYNKTKEEFLRTVVSNGEWNDIVLVPLNFLASSDLWSIGAMHSLNKNYRVYFCPLIKSHCVYLKQQSESYMLWGASAKMVLNLFQKHIDNDKNL